jgi:hypothetical protein
MSSDAALDGPRLTQGDTTDAGCNMRKPADGKSPQGVSRRTFRKTVGVGAAATGLAGAAVDVARAAPPAILFDGEPICACMLLAVDAVGHEIAAGSTFQVEVGPAENPVTLEVHTAPGDLRPWDLDSRLQAVKGRHPRLDGPAKVTGQARYTCDVRLPGMLWGKMVRAPVPAGRIVRVDTSYPEGQLPASPTGPRQGNVIGPVAPPPLGGARGGSRGDIEKGFAEAEIVHEATYRLAVHTHATFETHGIVAHWEGDQLTVYASTQGVFQVRAGLAEALGLPRNRLRVIMEHMGGGFGSKSYPSAIGSAFAVIAGRRAPRSSSRSTGGKSTSAPGTPRVPGSVSGWARRRTAASPPCTSAPTGRGALAPAPAWGGRRETCTSTART